MCYILLRPLRIVGRLVIVLCIETKKKRDQTEIPLRKWFDRPIRAFTIASSSGT